MRRGKAIERVLDAIQATPKKTDEEMRALDADELKTDKALKILCTGRTDAYEQALAALPKDKQKWWEEVLACEPDYFDLDEEPTMADAGGLLRFLKQAVLPSYTQRRTELKNRSLIRAQAFGEVLIPTGWNSLAVMRCISTVSSSVRLRCSSGCGNYAIPRIPTDPFRK
jgi:hypothetical protein